MPGTETYTNTWMDITFNCNWLTSPGDLPAPSVLSDWLTEIFQNYGQNLFTFTSLGSIDVWHPGRSDCPAMIKTYAGLTWPNGLMQINGDACNSGTISHEFGHWAMFCHQVGPEKDQAGKAVWDLYAALRGSDFTAATPASERWAEDFRSLFGAAGVKGTVSDRDDGKRKPQDVPGLQAFMLWYPPVIDYWRRTTFSRQFYDGPGATFYWLRSWPVWWWTATRWERFINGHFEYLDGNQWKGFTT